MFPFTFWPRSHPVRWRWRATTVDATELEAVYRAEAHRLWRALLGYTGVPDVADEAVAEAFSQLAGHRGEVREPVRWLWRAAFRIAAGELKRRRHAGSPLPEIPYEMPEPADHVLRALSSLSPMQRAAVVLHHHAGYRIREIAAITGSTPAAVKVHLSVGRRRLRAALPSEELNRE
jgi:DNA-directed RNA polymerase specialized sigma24 family protein